jgi:3-isopropylmalate/(R)-2-methylmalate dehydratase large subunit
LPSTIPEKILQKHTVGANSHRKLVPGEFVQAVVDFIMVHEQLGGRIHVEWEKFGRDHLAAPDKVALILDHWVPAPDIRAATMHQACRMFAKKYQFKYNFGITEGICHQVIPERGLARPGMLVVGSDSHTTTYGALNCFSTGIGATDACIVFATGQLWFRVPRTLRVNLTGELPPGTCGKDLILSMLRKSGEEGWNYAALEIGGPGLGNLSLDGRFTVANMAVEGGAKAAIFEGDNIAKQWVQAHTKESYATVKPDPGCEYSTTEDIDLGQIVPEVAKPFSPANVVPVADLPDTPISVAFLGSCTNGRLEDLRIAARLVKGQQVHSDVQLIVIPASRKVYEEALREGLIEIFIRAGAVVGHPTCGPCIGGSLGVLGPNDVCVSTSNRNFKGRMGHPDSRSYLASPFVVAASALAGKITTPTQPFHTREVNE